MESNWSKRFLYENGTRKAKPIVLIFICVQALFVVFLIITLLQLNNDELPKDDAERYRRMPELSISDLSKKASILTEAEVADIQKKVFKIVSENTPTVNSTKIAAAIHNDVVNAHSFSEHTKYVNMIIDIPELEQSYEVFYSTNAVIDPDVSTIVLCPDESKELTYPNFKCKSSDDKMYSRDQILAAYLKYFNSDKFSAYVSPDNPKQIIISPSITYNNDDKTKAKYINDVKDFIKSIGLAPGKYKYYVRTAADVNYNNNGY